MAILFNLITVICYTIKTHTNPKTVSLITKLLLTSHLIGHLIAWITIRLFLNELTYLSIAVSVLIGIFGIVLGNINCSKEETEISIEVDSPSRPGQLYVTAFLSSWITPAIFFAENSSKLYFKNVSFIQRKIRLACTSMATPLLQLIHLSSVALLLNLTDIFEPSNYINMIK
jgi:hypothetical protein